MTNHHRNRHTNDANHLFNMMNDFFQTGPIKNMVERMDDLFTTNPLTPSLSAHLRETEQKYIVSAHLPQIKKEQIQLRLAPHQLTINVTHQVQMTKLNDNHQSKMKEESFRAMSRTIHFTHPIIMDQVKAKFKNETILIELPKIQYKNIQIHE